MNNQQTSRFGAYLVVGFPALIVLMCRATSHRLRPQMVEVLELDAGGGKATHDLAIWIINPGRPSSLEPEKI